MSDTGVMDLLTFSDEARGDSADVFAMARAIEGFFVTVTLDDGGGQTGEVEYVDRDGVHIETAMYLWADIERIEFT